MRSGGFWPGRRSRRVASHVERHLDTLRERSPGQKHLLLMSKSINFVDMAGAQLLVEEARRRREAGGRLFFYSLRKPGQGRFVVGGERPGDGRGGDFSRP